MPDPCSTTWSEIFNGFFLYPERGYQTVQPVPEDVLASYRLLLSRGFDRQLLAPY